MGPCKTCWQCLTCTFKIRSIRCIKRCLRFIGNDEFDDFELVILVHEAIWDKPEGASKHSNPNTHVAVVCGEGTVETDNCSSNAGASQYNANYQQPLHIEVAQGDHEIYLDLCDRSDNVMGRLTLDTMKDVLLQQGHCTEKWYNLKPNKPCRNPKVQISMIAAGGHDDDNTESNLLANVDLSADVDMLVRQQLHKAKVARGEELHTQGVEVEGPSEMEVLQQACTGPLEMFQGLGKTKTVFATVHGPPNVRRWVIVIMNSEDDFLDRKAVPLQEVELLKIESVQADPTRHHVFIINYFDESNQRQTLTFRRIDRARDVWVEILHLVVTKVRAAHDQERKERQEKKKRLERELSMSASSSMRREPSTPRSDRKNR